MYFTPIIKPTITNTIVAIPTNVSPTGTNEFIASVVDIAAFSLPFSIKPFPSSNISSKLNPNDWVKVPNRLKISIVKIIVLIIFKF